MPDSLPYRPHEASNAGRGDESDDEEENFDETGYKTVKDAVLFAIEVSDSMRKKPPPSDSKKVDTHSPLLAALSCAYHLMQQRIISRPNDLMGILLYGTEATKFYDESEKSRGGYSFPGCYLLTDLNVPQASDVKALKRLVDDDSEIDPEFFVPSKTPVSMHTVLFCANQLFAQRAPNFTSRRLFLVTDNDNPHANDKALRNSATTRAKDLYDLGVMLELFPISSSTHAFDTQLFYDDIVYRSTPSDPDAVAWNPTSFTDGDSTKLKTGTRGGITLLESLLSNIASKSAPKRTLFASVPLEIAPNFRISVKGYLLYKSQKVAPSCWIYLGADRPLIATGTAVVTADDNSRQVEKAELRKAYKFGGEQICFTSEEMKGIRYFGDPVIRIIGFKPASSLPLWANIKSSTFIYPSEEDYVGSTRVFSALHHKLLKSNLMALTWYIARRNAAPVMAALIPTLPAETTNADDNLAGISATGCPQGLHLIPLPFADDIRQNPPTAPEKPILAPDELVDAMQLIIQQLHLPKSIYDPLKYPNPSLQWHYRILQALALDEDLPEKPEDRTVPKYRQINKRVVVEATDWLERLDKACEDYRTRNPGESPYGGAKRTNGEAAGPRNKRVKAEPEQVTSEEEMRRLWEKGTVAKLTVAELKEFCTAKRLALGGKKADIVERIEAFFESK